MLTRSPYDREIRRLAIPALGALIAEPLYVLADTAVVGHLGTPELGGLALASEIILISLSVFVFLAYGTTAAVARLIGAGDHREAAHQAVQGLWLALGLGVVLGAAGWVFADPLLRALGGEGEVLANGRVYLRISMFGLPAMLMSLAAVGYLRGLQDTVRPLIVALTTAAANLVLELLLIYRFDQGIGASALSTVLVQWAGALAYGWWIATAVRAHHVGLDADLRSIGRLARTGIDLFVRTAALRGAFVVAAAVAARIGTDDLGAHHISFAMWTFIALALDAVAIAGQAIIGRRLGGGDAAGARAAGRRMLDWGLLTGVAAGVLVIALRPVLPGVFSSDEAVLSLTAFLFLWLAVMQPANGLVFVLDGILIGAGDLRFLAWAMVAASAVFVPLAVAVRVLDYGIGWLWGAMVVFMMVRLAMLTARFRSDAWLVTGATR